jgi:hypothetical protein
MDWGTVPAWFSPDGPMLPGESRLFTHAGVGSGVLAVRSTDGDGENWVRSLHSYQLVRCPRDPVTARHFQRRRARRVLRTDQLLTVPHLTPLQHVGFRVKRYLLAPVSRYLLTPVVRCLTWPVLPLEPRARRGEGRSARQNQADYSE